MMRITPISDTIILLMVVKMCGRVSASRLHKVIYILKYKYRVPFNLRYESPLSIYSDDLEDDVGVLVAFGFLDTQIISREGYVDRVYRVTERGEKILEYILRDRDAEEMFNKLKLYLAELESLTIGELVYEAEKLIHKL
jgi:hypothetical protein